MIVGDSGVLTISFGEVLGRFILRFGGCGGWFIVTFR